MNKSRVTYLYQRYIDNAITEAELEEWKAILINPDADEFICDITKSSYHKLTDEELVEMRGNRSVEILATILGKKGLVSQNKKLWTRIVVAASVIFIMGLGMYFYNSNTLRNTQQNQAGINDIGPGGNKAYLTLANGKRISLSDAVNGTLAKQSNVEIIKTADGQLIYTVDGVSGSSSLAYNTIETPKGGKYEITLPDGTHVWLNSASTLKYPASFASLKERKVELMGEAYFEVAHNKSVPFRVASSGQTVEVLGTHFNVNAYPNEGVIKTTLLEGAVRVSLNHSKEFKVLKPGEQADVSGNKIQIYQSNADQVMGWKNGDFVFKGEGVESVMRQLARWYDIEVEYKGNVSDIGFVSTISKSKTLNEVIKVLQMTEGIHFKIEGRRVLVMP